MKSGSDAAVLLWMDGRNYRQRKKGILNGKLSVKVLPDVDDEVICIDC